MVAFDVRSSRWQTRSSITMSRGSIWIDLRIRWATFGRTTSQPIWCSVDARRHSEGNADSTKLRFFKAQQSTRHSWSENLLGLNRKRQELHPLGGIVTLIRVVAQFRSGHGPIPVLFECYRIRTDSGMPRLDIRFSTSHLMMASTR